MAKLEFLFEFLFLPALAIGIIAGALVTLFAVGALFDLLDHPEELQARLQTLFHPPLAPAKATGAGHYYQTYWS